MTDEAFTLHAWVDESMRVNPQGDQGTYILASAVCDPAGCEPIRDALRDLLTGKEPRLHWRDEDAGRRTKIAAAVADIDMAAVVVVGMPMEQKKQERARRICLETLLPELALMGVTQVFMEARTPSLMRKDSRHLSTMLGRKIIGPDLRVSNARPLEEPMLWLPDAVAGAVSAARAGQDQWIQQLRHTVTELEVVIR